MPQSTSQLCGIYFIPRGEGLTPQGSVISN